MTADFLDAPRRVIVTPTDRSPISPQGQIDVEMLKPAQFAVEHVTTSPDYGFEDELEKVGMGAVSARIGWMACDGDPQRADVSFRSIDGRRVFITPMYFNVWDPYLPDLIEQIPMRVVDVKARWPECAGWIHADLGGSDLDYAPYTRDEMGKADQRGIRDPESNPEDEGRCIVLACYSRGDQTMEPQVVGGRDLEPEEQYWQCPTCGYQQPNAQPQPDEMGMPQPTPEVSAQPQPLCPDCLKSPGTATPMNPVNRVNYLQDQPKYPEGKRLEYVLPRQGKILQDGPWPIDAQGFPIRMPPYMKIVRSLHPTDFCGISETTADAPMQVLSNALMERARSQIQSVGTIIGTTGRPTDGQGNDFQLTDEPVQFAFFDDPSGPSSINVIRIDPVPDSIFKMWQGVQTVLRQDAGTFEMNAATAQDLKGVQVGVTDIAEQTGSIPTNHFIRMAQRELGRFYGVILDMLRCYWTQQKWIEFQGPLGAMSYIALSKATIPNANFVISADPEKKVFDAEEMKSAMQWYQTGNPMTGGSPGLRRALGSYAGVDQSLMDDIDAADQQYAMQQMMQAAASGMTPQGPEAGAAGGPGKTQNGPEAGRPSGNGTPPSPMAMMAQRGMG